MTSDCSFLTDLELDGVISFSDSDRALHAGDFGAETQGWTNPPDAVAWPASTADVATIVKAANGRGIPVTPFAAGTSLEGHAVPAYGGVSLDMTRMNAILDIRPADFQIDVESGVLGTDIDDAAGEHGLFFPPIPSSGDISTIGGMIATDASGMKTVKYGEVADWVLELEAVLADGTIITAGSKAVKTSSGYNLKELVIGSEGTLAVVTRATLQLAGRPAQVRGGRVVFPTLEQATRAVTDAIQSGLDVATIELIDRDCAIMANAYSETSLPDRPMTFLEFHANHGVDEEIAYCRELFEAHDAQQIEMAEEARMADLWRARRDLTYAILEYDPDLTPLYPGDVTVPISSLGEIIRFAKALGEEHDILVPCFGHAGDGNVHYTVLVDESNPAVVDCGETIYRQTIRRAIELGGTATGEHGIGRGKREYLVAEHGDGAVEAMRTIKRALDPHDTLNPGKIFPETADGYRVRADSTN